MHDSIPPDDLELPDFLRRDMAPAVLPEVLPSFGRAHGGRPPKDWPHAEGGPCVPDAVARDFEAWALGWTESSPCPRCLWYVSWGRAADGMLVLTTEFGPVGTMWSREASPMRGPSITLLFTRHRPDGTCCELARLEIDASGHARHVDAGRRLAWRRVPDGGWDDFGLVYLMAAIQSRQQDLGLDSAIAWPMVRCLLDEGIPGSALVRQWHPLGPGRHVPATLPWRYGT